MDQCHSLLGIEVVRPMFMSINVIIIRLTSLLAVISKVKCAQRQALYFLFFTRSSKTCCNYSIINVWLQERTTEIRICYNPTTNVYIQDVPKIWRRHIVLNYNKRARKTVNVSYNLKERLGRYSCICLSQSTLTTVVYQGQRIVSVANGVTSIRRWLMLSSQPILSLVPSQFPSLVVWTNGTVNICTYILLKETLVYILQPIKAIDQWKKMVLQGKLNSLKFSSGSFGNHTSQ